jgi:hypothetical protein
VPQDDVTELVRHDARHLPFGVRRLDHAPVHEHGTARQREGIDLANVDRLEHVLELRMLQLRRNRRHQPLADVLHVRRHFIVVHDRQLLLDLRGGLPSELHVLRQWIRIGGRRDRGLRRQQGPGRHRYRGEDEQSLHTATFVQEGVRYTTNDRHGLIDQRI